MPRQALTDMAVKSATSKGKDQFEYPDTSHPGLILRVTCTGRKTWGFNFSTPDGQRCRMVLGLYPAMTLKGARDRWRAAHNDVSACRDPRHPASEAVPLKTVDGLMKDRVDLVLSRRRSREAVEHRYRKYIQPHVGSLPVEQFRIDPHYNAIIDPLIRAGTFRTAGIVFQDLRALFNFAVSRGVIEFSRLSKVKRPDPIVVRKRWLTSEEIVTVWSALPQALSKTPAIQRILRLCLLTGQRLSEVAGATRSEIDPAQFVWTIPGARTKNGHTHVVPLGPMAMTVFSEAMKETNGVFLFPNRNGTGPLLHRAIDHTLSRAMAPTDVHPLGRLGAAKFTPHDLRKTFATQMSRAPNGIAVPQQVIAHLLNHRSSTKSSVTQIVYDQNDFFDEKREAMLKWDTWLSSLTSAAGENAENSSTEW